MKVGDLVFNNYDYTSGTIKAIHGDYLEVEYTSIGGNVNCVNSHKTNWTLAPMLMVPPLDDDDALGPLVDWPDFDGDGEDAHTCEFKEYIGLMERYKYCVVCDKKESI